MTSLAAILGLFPLALGIGPGAQMQQPLAIMVIGGLTANMLFTRMVIPVGYWCWNGCTAGRPSGRRRRAAVAGPVPHPVRTARSPSRAIAIGQRRSAKAVNRENPSEMTADPHASGGAGRPARAGAAPAAAALELVQTIELKGKAGKLDHLALDAKRDRLFLANKANDTLDIVDLKDRQTAQADRRTRPASRASPTPPTWTASSSASAATASATSSTARTTSSSRRSSSPTTPTTSATTRAAKRGLRGPRREGARRDRRQDLRRQGRHQAAGRGRRRSRSRPSRPRLYLVTPSPSQVVVIDTDKNEVGHDYPIKMAAGGHAVALDEAEPPLFVGCRKEPMVVVMDTETGKEIASVPIPGGHRRPVLRRQAEAALRLLRRRLPGRCSSRRTPTTSRSRRRSPRRRGRRRACSTPDTGRLYLAVPRQEGKEGPEVRVYQAK